MAVGVRRTRSSRERRAAAAPVLHIALVVAMVAGKKLTALPRNSLLPKRLAMRTPSSFDPSGPSRPTLLRSLPLSAAITLEVELRLLEAGLGEGRLGGAEAAAVALPRWLFEICPGHLRLAAERPRRLRTGGQRAEVRDVHAVVHVPWCAYRGVHESCQLSAVRR